MKKTAIILSLTISGLLLSCTQKEPQFTSVNNKTYYRIDDYPYSISMEYENTTDLCADSRITGKNATVSVNVLVKNLPKDSVAVCKMMIAYADSIANGFEFMTKCPDNVSYFTIEFYKSTFGIRRYFKNIQSGTRYRDSEIPSAVGQDYIGHISCSRREKEECWVVTINRANGTFCEQGLANYNTCCLEITNNCKCYGNFLNENDEVLNYYRELKSRRQATEKQAETANNEIVVEVEQEETVSDSNETQFPLIGNTIGFISFDWDKWEENTSIKIEILNDNGSIWCSFDGNPYDYSERSRNPDKDFKPWAFEPGIGVFIMRCIAKSGNGYTIVANEEQNLVKQLEKHGYLKFQTVEEHISYTLVDTDFNLNPLREYPSDEAPIIDIINFDVEVISSIERKGDWIKITNSFTSEVLGWIRWKKCDRFMVWLYYSV
jgi:hypothetical protein